MAYKPKNFEDLRKKMPPGSLERVAEKSAEILKGLRTGEARPGDDERSAEILARKSDNLMRVTVQVGDRRFDEDLAQQAFIAPNVEAVNDALATNPGRYAEWAMLEALARAEVNAISGKLANFETDLKVAEAKLYLAASGTVDAIKAQVITHPVRLALLEKKKELDSALLEAKANLDKLTVGKKTMEEKRESLLELARNWRQEMQGKLQVSLGDTGRFRPGGR